MLSAPRPENALAPRQRCTRSKPQLDLVHPATWAQHTILSTFST